MAIRTCKKGEGCAADPQQNGGVRRRCERKNRDTKPRHRGAGEGWGGVPGRWPAGRQAQRAEEVAVCHGVIARRHAGTGKKKSRRNAGGPFWLLLVKLAGASLLLQLRNLRKGLPGEFPDDEQIGWTEAGAGLPVAALVVLVAVGYGGVVHRPAFRLIRPDGQLDAAVLELGDRSVSRLGLLACIGAFSIGLSHVFLRCWLLTVEVYGQKYNLQVHLRTAAALPGTCRRSVLCRQAGIRLAVLTGLAAQFHEARGNLLFSPAALRGHEAPEKIRAADIGAALAMVERRAIDAALVIRPAPATG